MLRGIARQLMLGERENHTLQATALVNEAYMKSHTIASQHRGQFVVIATRALRQVLVDHARSKRAIKRGGPGRDTTDQRGHTAADSLSARWHQRIEAEGADGSPGNLRDSVQTREPADLSDPTDPSDPSDPALHLMMDEVLTDFARVDARTARLIELRYFGGLTMERAASVLGISVSTAEKNLAGARLWLRDRLA